MADIATRQLTPEDVAREQSDAAHSAYADHVSAALQQPDDAVIEVQDPQGNREAIERRSLSDPKYHAYRVATPKTPEELNWEQAQTDAKDNQGQAAIEEAGRWLGGDLIARAIGGQDAARDVEARRQEFESNHPYLGTGLQLAGGVLGGLAAGIGGAAEGAEALDAAGVAVAKRYGLGSAVESFGKGAIGMAPFSVLGSANEAARDPNRDFGVESVLAHMGPGNLVDLAFGGALGLGGDLLSPIVKGILERGKASAAEEELLGSYREATAGPQKELETLGAQTETPAPEAAAPSAPAETAPVSPGNVEDFQKKYNKMTVASRQNVRQFEGLVSGKAARVPGYVMTPEMEQAAIEAGKVTPELAQATRDLEAARAKTQSMLPMEGNTSGARSYEETDPMFGGSGERGGSYAKGQGKISMHFTGTPEEVAAAARAPGFREALAEHQAALDRAQSLLPNNKAYPPVIEPNHPIFDATPVAPANGLAGKSRAQLGALFGIDLTEVPPSHAEIVAQRTKSATKALAGHQQAFVDAAEKLNKPASARELLEFARAQHPELTSLADLKPSEMTNLKASFHEARLSAATGEAAPAESGLAHSAAGVAKVGVGRMVGSGVRQGSKMLFGSTVGHLVSHAVGVPFLGPILGAGVGGAFATMTTRPLTRAIKRMIFGGAGRYAAGVDKVISAAAKAEGTVSPAAVILRAHSFGDMGVPKDATLGDLYKVRSLELAQAVARPEQTKERLAKAFEPVAIVDKKTATELVARAFARLTYLAKTMPQMTVAGPLLGKRADMLPTAGDIGEWAKRVKIAGDPNSFFTALAAGQVSPVMVETMEACYPETLDRIRTDIANRASQLDHPLPWSTQLSMSMVMAAPVNSLFAPYCVKFLQAIDQVKPQPQGAGGEGGAVKPPQQTKADSFGAPLASPKLGD
jgi:hypothetical protein